MHINDVLGCQVADTWEDADELPAACACGNWAYWWWDGNDKARCAKCDPPVKPLERLAKTYLRRNTAGQPVDDVVEFAQGLKFLMRTAGAEGADRNYLGGR